MKALKIEFGEWHKLADFVNMINEEADSLAYGIDATTALLVAQSACGLEWIMCQAARWFDNFGIETIK